jgi:cell division protein FtsL
MADTFADAFKRYWAIILTVAGALLYAGGVYSNVQAQIANLNSDIRAYMVEREGLLRDINGNFSRIDERLDRLEQP